MAPEDTELILQAQRGDMTAFERLVYRHDKQVLSIAARYVSSAEDAKDIYQEVFLRVYRGLKRFQLRSEFSTWLYRITTNVCLTHHKRQRRHHHVSLDGEVEGEEGEGHPVAPLRSNDPLPDSRPLDAEISHLVEGAISTLPPKQRLVFTLRHYQGYKLKEIASMMSCTQGTVKRYLFLATRQMRRELKELCD